MNTRYQDPHPAMTPQMQQYMQQQQMQQLQLQQMNNQMQPQPQFTPEMMQQFMLMQQALQNSGMMPQMQPQQQGGMGQQMAQQHMMNLQRQRMMNNGMNPQMPAQQFQNRQQPYPQQPTQNTFGFNTRNATAGFAMQQQQEVDDNRFGGPQVQPAPQLQPQPPVQRQAIDPNALIKPQAQEPVPMEQHPTTGFTVETGKFHFTNNSVNFARNQNALSKTNVMVVDQFAVRNYSELFNDFEAEAEKHSDGPEAVKVIRSEGYVVNPNILVEMVADVRAMFDNGVDSLHEQLTKTLAKEKRKPELRALSFINEQVTKAVNFYLEVIHPGILIDNFVEDYHALIEALSDYIPIEPETINNFTSYMSDFAGPLASEVSVGDDKGCFGYTLKALYLRDRYREDLGLELLKDCKVIEQNKDNEHLLSLIESEVDFSENYELVIMTVDGFAYVVRKVLHHYTIAVV